MECNNNIVIFSIYSILFYSRLQLYCNKIHSSKHVQYIHRTPILLLYFSDKNVKQGILKFKTLSYRTISIWWHDVRLKGVKKFVIIYLFFLSCFSLTLLFLYIPTRRADWFMLNLSYYFSYKRVTPLYTSASEVIIIYRRVKTTDR